MILNISLYTSNQCPLCSKIFWSSSYKTSTSELPILLQKLDKLPLKNPVTPSVDKIFDAQSNVPLYCLSAGALPLSIINLLLIVSRG